MLIGEISIQLQPNAIFRLIIILCTSPEPDSSQIVRGLDIHAHLLQHKG